MSTSASSADTSTGRRKPAFSEAELAAAEWSKKQREISKVSADSKKNCAGSVRHRDRSPARGHHGRRDSHRDRRNRSRSRSRERYRGDDRKDNDKSGLGYSNSSGRSSSSGWRENTKYDENYFHRSTSDWNPSSGECGKRSHHGWRDSRTHQSRKSSNNSYKPENVGRDPAVRGRTRSRSLSPEGGGNSQSSWRRNNRSRSKSRSTSPYAREYSHDGICGEIGNSKSKQMALNQQWGHDKFDAGSVQQLQALPERRHISADYRPPSPTWRSRAGGVAVMVKKNA